MTRPTSRIAYDDGNDRWEIVHASPAPPLRGIVDRYSWWTEETRSFTARRELAATTGVFIVNLGATLEIVDARGQTHRLAAGEGFVGGMAQATSLSRSTGAMAGIHIHLPPANLARLLGIPLAEIADRVVPMGDLPDGSTRMLGTRLLDATTLDTRLTLLDDFLATQATKAAGDAAADDREIRHISRLLARGERVERIAQDIGWSRKRLARRFRDATGLLPRSFAGLARFERFTKMLAAAPQIALADAAIAVGYADQAHLTREVGRFSAMTPGELRARLIPAGGGVRD